MEQEDNNSSVVIQQFDFEDPEICSSEDWTVASGKTKTANKNKDDNNQKIPGHHRIKIKINNDIFKVEFFETGYQPGINIRNALTGAYYNHKTGTFDEYFYFKVVDACYSGKNPYFLFYDSPEQFERHFFCSLPKETKRKWLERYNEEMSKRKAVHQDTDYKIEGNLQQIPKYISVK
jgi:hypothetical protein